MNLMISKHFGHIVCKNHLHFEPIHIKIKQDCPKQLHNHNNYLQLDLIQESNKDRDQAEHDGEPDAVFVKLHEVQHPGVRNVAKQREN